MLLLSRARRRRVPTAGPATPIVASFTHPPAHHAAHYNQARFGGAKSTGLCARVTGRRGGMSVSRSQSVSWSVGPDCCSLSWRGEFASQRQCGHSLFVKMHIGHRRSRLAIALAMLCNDHHPISASNATYQIFFYDNGRIRHSAPSKASERFFRFGSSFSSAWHGNNPSGLTYQNFCWPQLLDHTGSCSRALE